MAERRKLENVALVVPVFGAMLFVPPLISIFNVDTRVLGLPLVVFYLFAVWLALIAGTALLSRHLPRQTGAAASPPPPALKERQE